MDDSRHPDTLRRDGADGMRVRQIRYSATFGYNMLCM